MLYGSVCSGIESATVAWSQMPLSPAWFSEIESFPNAVLMHHYKDIKNLGDMTKIAKNITNGTIVAPDILVGGTPCQAFSLLGYRKGLEDERGQLTLNFVELADAIDKKRQQNNDKESIIIWENVPGVLNSKDNAFGYFISALAGENEPVKCAKKWTDAGVVYGKKRNIAWRVLDAQYFGVPQRRRRVFVVASARTNFEPTRVLFDFEPIKKSIKKKDKISTLTQNGNQFIFNKQYGIYRVSDVFGTLLTSQSEDLIIDFDKGIGKLSAEGEEELQGFPVGYTAILYNGKFASNSVRCKALGNSMAVPVMKWIGKRLIKEVNRVN